AARERPADRRRGRLLDGSPDRQPGLAQDPHRRDPGAGHPRAGGGGVVPLQRYTAGEWLARPADRAEAGGTPEQRAAVRAICGRVAAEGDAAVRELGLRFDGWAPADGESWALDRADMEQALDSLPDAQRSALELAARRIRAFHETQTFA